MEVARAVEKMSMRRRRRNFSWMSWKSFRGNVIRRMSEMMSAVVDSCENHHKMRCVEIHSLTSCKTATSVPSGHWGSARVCQLLFGMQTQNNWASITRPVIANKIATASRYFFCA